MPIVHPLKRQSGHERDVVGQREWGQERIGDALGTHDPIRRHLDRCDGTADMAGLRRI